MSISISPLLRGKVTFLVSRVGVFRVVDLKRRDKEKRIENKRRDAKAREEKLKKEK